MPRFRRIVAVACVAVIVVAAFMPLGGAPLEWAVVSPVFILLTPLAVRVALFDARGGDEYSLALLSILDSRGPPAGSSLA